ncbi:MAG: ATP-binding protein [Bilophila wadsworthia]
MRVGLYQKFFTWAMLNLVLLGVITALFIGGVLLFNNNLYSPMLFNGSIASTFRMTSVELQYKPENQWASVLEECGRECGLHFDILILDDMDPPLAAGGLPPRVVEAARTIPRPPYSLCAEPDSGAFSTITPAVELEAGILPQQYVIFMRDGDPAQYWYARTILVSNDEGVVRYVLLAASSPSITGNGHFFELRLAVALLLSGLGLSFLWWWPFVRHLTKPIILMTKVTERIAAGDYSSLSDDSPISLKAVGEGRGDQIGCPPGHRHHGGKGQTAGPRAAPLHPHIAHELDSPLARIAFRRLDSRWTRKTSSAYRKSATREQLSLLVEDVLSFMRSEAIPESPAREAVSLAPLLQYVTRREARDRDVRLSVDEGLKVWADASCLGRALANVVRNAVRYAGEDGPIAIAARPQGDRVCVEIRDSGPGVPAEEMEHITEPFFRGEQAKKYPGGSGLGMSIVKHCVEACGGELHYYNQYPKGFTVSITLKACDK